MAFVALTTPASDSERLTTVSLLEAYGISCFIRGGAFSALYPGAQLGSRNALTILVPEEQLRQAQLILAATPEELENGESDTP
ncbi:MAG: hypothetical protein ABI616_13285 [Pseudomonadota bacterium]